MPPRTIENYGGVKEDVLTTEYPTGEESASEHNRLTEDVAQMTRTSAFATVMFLTTTDAAPAVVSAANVTVRSHAGNGSSAKPVVTKTATGLYTLTFAESYTDAIEVEEDVVIAIAKAHVTGETNGHAQVRSWTDTTVNVRVTDTANADSDLAGAARVIVEVQF